MMGKEGENKNYLLRWWLLVHSGPFLGLPIVHLCVLDQHLGVVFCLGFSPFYFLLLFPCQVFFLLFIYLFGS
jgi:hypothetical protein